MSSELIHVILWFPFLFLFAIYGSVYSISGYKKGLYRALISVGATVVSGIISAILAKLFAPGIADSLYNAFLSNKAFDNEVYSKILSLFTKSVVRSIVTLLVFSFFIFLITIILKIVASNLTKNKFEPQNKGMRWGGLGVRFVEAALFSVILLLPFYGTLATYSPIAESLYSYSTQGSEVGTVSEDDEVLNALNVVKSNLLVNISKSKPIQGVYNGLSGTQMEDVSLNVPEMVSTCEGVFSRFNDLIKLPEDQQGKATEELVDYIDKNIVGKDWLYDLFNLIKNELLNYYADSIDDLSGNDRIIFDEFVDSLEISKKDFDVCFKEGIDFSRYFLKVILIEKQLDGNEIAVLYNDEFLTELGELLNCNDAVLPVKKLLWLINSRCLIEDFEEAMRFMEAHPQKLHSDINERIKEAGAVLMGFKQTRLAVAEAMVRHPDFGFEAVKDYVSPEVFAELIYITHEDDPNNPAVLFLTQNPDILEDLIAKLKECENTPLSADYFYEYASQKMQEYSSEIFKLADSMGYNSMWGADVEFDSSVQVYPGGYSFSYYG